MNGQQLTIGGGVVFWRVAKSTSIEEVRNGLDNLGLNAYCPEPRNALSCLRAAIDNVYFPPNPKEERYVFRPVKNGVKGFAVVCEHPKEHKAAGDDWGEVVATAGFDEQDNLTIDPWDSDKMLAIQAGMEGAARWLTRASVSKSLVELAEKECDAVALRPSGGVYWIRDVHLERWERIAKVFESASAEQDENGEPATPTSVYVLRVVADEQMVRAVGDALTSEIELALANIEGEIQNSSMGQDAYVTRLRRVGELAEKVKRYEAAFQRPLESLSQAVGRSAVAVAQASLQASAAAQAARRGQMAYAS